MQIPTVLLAKCIEGEYVFETRANNSTAKTPMGCFDSLHIPNDMRAVDDALRDYMGMDPIGGDSE